MKKNKSCATMLIIAAIIIIIDQISKFIIRRYTVLNTSIPVIKNIFHLTYVANKGSLFGLFKNISSINIFLISVSFIVIIFLIYYINKNSTSRNFFLPAALLLGGTVGNLIDRILFGHVIDFIDFRVWPVFNIADVSITVGVSLLVFYEIRRTKK